MPNCYILPETQAQLLVALSRQAFDLARKIEQVTGLVEPSQWTSVQINLRWASSQADELSAKFVALAKETESKS